MHSQGSLLQGSFVMNSLCWLSLYKRQKCSILAHLSNAMSVSPGFYILLSKTEAAAAKSMSTMAGDTFPDTQSVGSSRIDKPKNTVRAARRPLGHETLSHDSSIFTFVTAITCGVWSTRQAMGQPHACKQQLHLGLIYHFTAVQ